MTDESLRDASRRNAQSARPPRSMMSSTAAALKPKPDCICRCSISFLLPFEKRSYYIIFSAKTVGHSRNPPRKRPFPRYRPIKSRVPRGLSPRFYCLKSTMPIVGTDLKKGPFYKCFPGSVPAGVRPRRVYKRGTARGTIRHFQNLLPTPTDMHCLQR